MQVSTKLLVTRFYMKITSSKLRVEPWTAVSKKLFETKFKSASYLSFLLRVELLNCMLLKPFRVTETKFQQPSNSSPKIFDF